MKDESGKPWSVLDRGQCFVSAKPTLALVLPQSLLDQCIFQVN